MAPNVTHSSGKKRRLKRVAAAGFFPGEVARILGLKGVDYRQLRDMLRLAREVRGDAVEGTKWARYSFTDLCALRVIVDLFGGADQVRNGARLELQRLRATCMHLRKLGFANPLLQVKLTSANGSILAQADGVRFEAATGQLLLDSVYRKAVEAAEHKQMSSRRELKRERTKIEKHARNVMQTGVHLIPVQRRGR